MSSLLPLLSEHAARNGIGSRDLIEFVYQVAERPAAARYEPVEPNPTPRPAQTNLFDAAGAELAERVNRLGLTEQLRFLLSVVGEIDVMKEIRGHTRPDRPEQP